MTDTIIVQPVVNEVTVTEDVNQVVVSSVGVQGPAGATGATGATGDTGAQGPSGVVTVNAPLTNAGTSSAANLSISAGTTSAAGALQLTDSVASTSTTTAATPNAVKTAYDYAQTRTITIKAPSGYYVQTPNGSHSNMTATTNRSNFLPIYLPTTTSLDRIAVLTSSAFSGTGLVRMGIYAHDITTGLPSTLILDAGTVSCTSSNTTFQITISQTLPSGSYWLVMNIQTAATVNGFIGLASSIGNMTGIFPYRSSPSLNPIIGYFTPNITGAFTDATGLDKVSTLPHVYVRTV